MMITGLTESCTTWLETDEPAPPAAAARAPDPATLHSPPPRDGCKGVQSGGRGCAYVAAGVDTLPVVGVAASRLPPLPSSTAVARAPTARVGARGRRERCRQQRRAPRKRSDSAAPPRRGDTRPQLERRDAGDDDGRALGAAAVRDGGIESVAVSNAVRRARGATAPRCLNEATHDLSTSGLSVKSPTTTTAARPRSARPPGTTAAPISVGARASVTVGAAARALSRLTRRAAGPADERCRPSSTA